MSASARLAVIADFAEEAWPSMDLCAEMLCRQLAAEPVTPIRATRICPNYRHRARVLPVLGIRKGALNLDRLLNRFWDYPRYLRRHSGAFDFFHICDHSYSQLVHALPSQRTGVVCHDLDAFRCLLEPSLEPRPRWFRWMARKVLDGLQKAAVVFHVSNLTRYQIERYGLIDPSKLIHAPNGIAPEFTPETAEDIAENIPLTRSDGRPFLLHVGSCIARKRIDVLLDVFAGVKARYPDLTLVQVGGSWTRVQQEQIERLGIGESLLQQRALNRKSLAALYRRAVLVLQPSEAEGFGLPVIEALACGGIVVASDIPVLREVGGKAAVYCPVADVPAWVDTACHLLDLPATAPDRSTRLAHAQRYSWSAQARTILTAYEQLVQRT